MLGHSAGLTRADLSRLLGLSKATVSALVGDLVERGAVTEVARTGGGVGRPGTLVRLAGAARTFVTLMWNGKDMRICRCDFAGTIVTDRSLQLSTQLTPDELVAVITRELDDPDSVAGVVLSLPAPFQRGVGIPPPGGVALGSALPDSGMWLHGRWLVGDPVPALAAALGRPVLAENDANLAALGEYTHGAGRGHDSVAYVKVTANTIGMGLVLGGRMHRGASGFAGELAHIQVDPNGPLCYCGGRGCLRGLLGSALLDAVRPAYDRPLTFADVLALAADGDPGPRRMLDDLGRTLGRALADFCTLLNPSAIIIDGGLGAAGAIVADAVRESIGRHSAPHAAQAVRVLHGALGQDDELHGARELLTDAARAAR